MTEYLKFKTYKLGNEKDKVIFMFIAFTVLNI